jgi:hypothetical protein
VLYYGCFPDEDTLIFIEKSRAEYNAKIHTAMARAEDQGLTWQQFKKKYPELFKKIWAVLEDCDLLTFDEWLQESKYGRVRQSSSQPEETSTAKSEYMKLMQWDRMPLMEERFVGQVVLEHAPLLAAPYDGSEMWIPREITDEFGTVEEGFFVDPYVTFKAKDIRKLTKAFRRHGYLCKRNDRLIEKARGVI